MFPDFIGIGAQKSGTTWLYHNLRSHPRIWMPREKEIHYFGQKSEVTSFDLRSRVFGKRRGDRRWRDRVKGSIKANLKNFDLAGFAWTYRYHMRPYGDDWYASLFKPGRGRIAGEITPYYSILDRGAIAHAHRLMPEAKIVFMMRNPIERDWSHAVMHFDKAGRSIASVPEAEILEARRDNDSRRFSDYLRTLDNWGAFYPEEQIFVGFLEDVHFRPDRLLRRLYAFLLGPEAGEPPEGHEVMKRRIHTRYAQSMPTRLAAHLAKSYREDLARLEERFGGYASFWRYCAGRLIEKAPSEARIPYPLWESSLWEEWVGSSGEAEVQSGPLSSIRNTARGRVDA